MNASREFNLATESYGGHYGPTFYRYFYDQNQKIQNGSMPGYEVNFNSLSLINAIIDAEVQEDWYPEFAVNNTYGIKAYNDTVYSYAKFANNMFGGCRYQIGLCRIAAGGNGTYFDPAARITTADLLPSVKAVCSEAANMCRDNVEGPYYYYSGRGTYDIRHPTNDPTPPDNFISYLNDATVQEALGVTVNYTQSNTGIFYAFQNSGDWVFPNYRLDLEYLLNHDVRVSLAYGDADYICKFSISSSSLFLPFTWE